MQVTDGYFIIDNNTALQFNTGNKELAALATYFKNQVIALSGHSLAFNQPEKKPIRLQITPLKELRTEGYQLSVTPTHVVLKANAQAGLFYGLQSLLQALPPIRTNEALQVPCMQISDYPRFGWRGMMLDVSRHFYSVAAIKELLDLLALYKMNVFHWHLTDNEGWRIEIKKYPELTSVGAWRQEVPGSIFYSKDSIPRATPYTYGGYYTQEEVRQVVAYAKERNITVIPEIEMPGHSGAALAAYPQFSCSPHNQNVPNSSTWNGRTDTKQLNFNYCAGNDSAFFFLQDVLDEVMQLFPSEYIHIGGDEVDKWYWKNCSRCQKRIKDEHLKSEEELQSYFIRRMERYLMKHHKKLIGWDEILEGGLAPSATVMSWRGEKGGIAAARQGHPVIMSPSNPLYFNRYQADPEEEPLAAKYSINTLEKVYQYDPHSAELNKQEGAYILGAQCALWTEFIASVEHLEYMLLPRLPAIAEALWTPAGKKNFDDFVNRLDKGHCRRWQQKGQRFHSKKTTL
jgi:hexosaminidase